MKHISMKKILLLGGFIAVYITGFAQAQELEQLALNIEKLAQFRKILSDMKSTYEVLESGYSTIRDISKGNFTLHKSFLDKLLTVSPAVRQYSKVGEIVSLQLNIVKECQSAKAQIGRNKSISAAELNYIASVYTQLVQSSLLNLDALLNVVTAGKLRMSDAERLQAIDHIYDQMREKIAFVRHFNASASILAAQKKKELIDLNTTRKLYDLK